MNVLGRLFQFYLKASVHVALAAVCLLAVTVKSLNISFPVYLGSFLFLATVACYNFVKYGLEGKKYARYAGGLVRWIMVFSVLAAVLALYPLCFLSPELWWPLIILGLFSGLYAVPVLPKMGNMRSWGGLKIFIVALVWTGATVFLPVLEANVQWSWDVGVMAVERVLFVLVLLLPFEIRDLPYDEPSLQTLPQRFGVRGTKKWGGVMVLLFFLSHFFRDGLEVPQLLVHGTITLVLLGILLGTKTEQGPYFASFWVEAVPLLWYALLLWASWLW
ncbi:hypothetical protein [Maribacter sp. 2307ULW6-5]|uniref:hypothetical protein n=1 Tax=Maribacter sp. 2307ULW6-5 TaxID=3386275 RepID=UPI0039BC4F20